MKKKNSWSFRKLVNDLHLWLGIGSGIIIFLICFSGSILAFDSEIKAAFAEDLQIQEKGSPKNLSQLSSSIEQKGLGELSSISIPQEKGEFYEVRIKTSPEDRRGTTFLLNPYTSEVSTRPPSKANGFLATMFRMHRWLMLDSKIGRPIVGIATIIFLFLAISGLFLWFPKKLKWKNIKKGFKIKTAANWKRINHDLHYTVGFYSLLLILIMGLTGLCWSFQWYREVAGDLIGAKVFNRGGERKYELPEYDPSKTTNLEDIMEIIQQELPYEGKTFISFPSENSPVFSIRKYNSSSLSPVTGDQLILAQDGTVTDKEIFSDKPFNVQVASLIKPIHTGEIFGNFSKFIYFLACLFTTSLPVTGTIIWINSLKNKSMVKKKKKDQMST